MKKIIITLFSIFFLFGSIVNSQSAADTTYYKRLFYTGKVWGFLKYFHSKVAKGENNWDLELISALQKINNHSSEVEFNKTIMHLIDTAGVCSYSNTSLPNIPDSLKFNLDFSWFQDSTLSDSVRSNLDTIRAKFRPQENYYVGEAFAGGNPAFDNDNQFYTWVQNQYPDKEYRLLALFRYWNIINYFFPYKNIMDQNWDSTLVEFIPKIINSANTRSYNLTFLELATRINDSHASTYSEEINERIVGRSYLPLTLKYVENETVVTGVLTDNENVKIGDVIKGVDGNDIYSLRDSLRRFTKGSNNSIINYGINSRIIKGSYGEVELVVENPNGQYNVTLPRHLSSTQYYSLISDTDSIWHFIQSDSKNYGYVDMGRLEVEHIEPMFNKLWNTDALIFDIRNYPNGTMWYMVDYLFDRPINVANFTVPDINYPGTLFWHYEYVGSDNSTPNYNNPIFILFDESTQSQAEYTIMAFEQHPQAIKIGSQTSGADGNVSKIYLPGGIVTYFTGLGTFYPDFTQTQRVGIIPDIEVLPTIAGIREGRDEVLEAALNYNITKVNEEKDSAIPNDFALYQNYPNPFNPTTTINYSIPSLSVIARSEATWQSNSEITSSSQQDGIPRNDEVNVTLTVYDILGREVATLVNEKQKPGYYEVSWPVGVGTSKQPSGVYFYQLKAGNYVETKKMVLIR